MAEGDGQRVGGVRGLRGFLEIEECLDHKGDLTLAAAAIRGDELLDFARLVEDGRKAGLRRGEERDRARFADGDGGADVADDEVFDRDFVGAGITNDVREGFVDGLRSGCRLRGRGRIRYR